MAPTTMNPDSSSSSSSSIPKGEKKTHCRRVLKRSLSDFAAIVSRRQSLRPVRSSSDPKDVGEVIAALENEEKKRVCEPSGSDHPAGIIKKIDDTIIELLTRIKSYLTAKESVQTVVEEKFPSKVGLLAITNGYCDLLLQIKDAIEHYYTSALTIEDQHTLVSSFEQHNATWKTLYQGAGIVDPYDGVATIVILLDQSLTAPAKKLTLSFNYEYVCLMFEKLKELIVD